MKMQLQDVFDRILAVEPTAKKELQAILEHELQPLIEENDIFKSEFERRIQYYENLINDANYNELIKNIHTEINALQKLIDPKKLPDEPRLFEPKHDDLEREPWITMKEFHSILDRDDKWWKLGKVTTMQANDSVKTSWRPVIRQYQLFLALVENAYKHEAISLVKADKHLEVLNQLLDDLKKILEQPFVRLHIHDFEFLDHYMKKPQWIGDSERDVKSIQKYAERVYKDLKMTINSLEERSYKKEEQIGDSKIITKQDCIDALEELLETIPDEKEGLIKRGDVYRWLEQSWRVFDALKGLTITKMEILGDWLYLYDVYDLDQKYPREDYNDYIQLKVFPTDEEDAWSFFQPRLVQKLDQEIKRVGARFNQMKVSKKSKAKTDLGKVVYTSDKKSEVRTDANVFRYGNSITDCEANYIWTDGNKEYGQKLTHAKRRYIWEFCRKYCDKGFQSYEDLNKYISTKLNRSEKVTIDDMKGFWGLVSKYSNVPIKDLKVQYIVFHDQKGIEVKNVPL